MPSASTRSACLTSSGQPWAASGTLCPESPAAQAPMGDCGPRGGVGEQGGDARRNAGRHRRPQAQPGLQAAGRGGSYPAQRDQATSTAHSPGRGPRASGWSKRGVVLSDVLRADKDTLEGRNGWHHHTLSSPQGPQLLPLVPIPVLRID